MHMVKKAAQALPNQLLRRARLERGWTQKVVAERIGAPNTAMVTRWESGAAFPSPYYVERLCQLFEQKASDLGLLPELQTRAGSQRLSSKASWPGLPREQAGELVSTSSAAQQIAPVVPLSHLPLIGREADTRLLRDRYRAAVGGQTHAVLLQGEAGIGKTHLASASCSGLQRRERRCCRDAPSRWGEDCPINPWCMPSVVALNRNRLPRRCSALPG